jgi:hypothetical protein
VHFFLQEALCKMLFLQCCKNGMMYCSSGSGYGSYFRKVLLPVPVPVPDPYLFRAVFQQQFFLQNLAFSMLEAALIPRKLASNF